MSSDVGRNRLAEETSPYLLQHKDNPVHWWAWGPEALAEAKRADKPILLSVGYAACHWCHVMAHESFENEATANVMNERFINIKVDREERPDIDAIYMGALHRLGEQGGWPLTMFLDIDARPFWGGTYFPPESRWGKPSFTKVLTEISRIWREEPDKVAKNAEGLTAMLARVSRSEQTVVIDDDMLRGISSRIVEAFDGDNGGLRGAPKFPQWSILWLVWRGAIRYANPEARDAILNTLTHICQGGIYDHLAGGFARYSVDDRWLVPHFEKMLYDNALLLDLLTEAWRETRNPLFAARVSETIGWLQREMIADHGAFAASLDADSEGEEGKFYVWSKAEITDLLGKEDGALFCRIYDVTSAGNFEGHSILNRLGSLAPLSPEQEDRLADLRARLLAARGSRIRPGWDDKVLADWNGLMIAALVNAARVFDQPGSLALARRAFEAVVANMSLPDGRLLHASRSGQAKAPATANDYAAMIWAAIRLYTAAGQPADLDRAIAWASILDRHYWLADAGGYCMTADDTPDVIARLRTASDDATPNANALMISNLAHLSLLTGDQGFMVRAQAIPNAFAADLQRNLVEHCGLLSAAHDLIAPSHILVSVPNSGVDATRMCEALRSMSLPGALEQIVQGTAAMPSASVDIAAKTAPRDSSTAYICVGTQCSAPIVDPEELSKTMRVARSVIRGA
jgi:uncharacterized protein YyaL (SSP411 family)